MRNIYFFMSLCVFSLSCEKSDSTSLSRGRRGGKIPVVRIETVKSEIQARQLNVIATLTGRAQADVYSKVSGKMSYFGPREGEEVRAGTLLFRVDRNDPGESFLNVPITSPLSGWVGRWGVTNIGEQITPQDPVVTIVDDRALRATTLLPLEDWLNVKKGTKVTAQALGETRDAKVLAVARSAEAGSGRAPVTVEIPNEKREWRSGMTATVNFFLEPKNRILINAAALIITNDGAFVYVVDNNVAKRKRVVFDVINNDTVEVTDGLNADEQIIVMGANLVSDNSPVEIAAEKVASKQ